MTAAICAVSRAEHAPFTPSPPARSAMRGPGESYSDVILRLAAPAD
jgi:hypothetical protein